MKTLSYVVLLLLSFAVPVRAAGVYSGCAVPPTTFRHVWYFDPVHGKTQAAGGNGSQATPWNNLQALVQGETGYPYPLLTTAPYLQSVAAGKPWVTTTGPKAGPIAPGDEILLMSGNYGNLWLNVWTAEISNSAFVTIASASGQTPVLTSLLVSGTNEWVFDGLKVQSLQPAALNGDTLVEVNDGGASFPTSNIVFENMTISSQDNAEAWSKAQWVANARTGFFARSTAGAPDTKCISFTGSHISNVRTGASLEASQLVFSNNQIDHFGDDGIDYAASSLSITHNDIHDNLDIGDGNHEDAMQGQIGYLAPGATVNYFRNILIDSNLIVRQTDPELSFPTYLQGIDAFDEDWTDVTVTNNVIVTSACPGISFASIHNSLIANNTVVEDGLVSTPGCTAAIDVGGASHEGPLSTNTVVRNNLSSQLNVDTRNSGVVADHNVVMCCGGREISWYVNGAIQYLGNPGTYANANIIDSGGAKSEFLNFNPSTLTYNVMLKSGAQAIGAGIATGAPTVDILGDKRAAPYTAGAYSYPQ
jgi:Right handed beta helix region